MAKKRTCLAVPGYSQHVVQRGNSRQACFLDESDTYLILPWKI